MDTITHAIIGATLARATAPSAVSSSPPSAQESISLGRRTWLGGLAAAFPDIDYIAYPLDPLSFISDWHRGETHSLVMLPLWALLLGLALATIVKHKQQWREIALICVLSIFSHILSDLITSWGTQIFAPLSALRVSLGTTFIIDPYFTFIILSGLVLSTLKNSKTTAQIALAALTLYIAMQGLVKLQVYQIGKAQAASHQWLNAQVNTMPQPLSPFYWKIIISEGDRYHMAYIDLLAGDDKLPPLHEVESLLEITNHYRPPSRLSWSHYSRYGEDDEQKLVRSAWQRPEFERYRRFAAYPIFVRQQQSGSASCMVFMDLRFAIPHRNPPFSYAMCRDENENGSWTVRQVNLVMGKVD